VTKECVSFGHRPSWAYAYKIDYVNYICPLNVEKLIVSARLPSKTQPLGRLGP
jgi:hypothetical protein